MRLYVNYIRGDMCWRREGFDHVPRSHSATPIQTYLQQVENLFVILATCHRHISPSNLGFKYFSFSKYNTLDKLGHYIWRRERDYPCGCALRMCSEQALARMLDLRTLEPNPLFIKEKSAQHKC